MRREKRDDQQSFGGRVRTLLEGLEARVLMSAVVGGHLQADGINPLPGEFGTIVGVPSGKTLILPLSAESDGQISYTVTASSGWKVTVRNPADSVFVDFHVRYGADLAEGDIVIQLFSDIAPNTVSVISGYINAGKYNNTPFQRVIDDFVVQGGDFGNGMDAATLGDGVDDTGSNFADEFSPNAIFSGNGQLAMANSGKDTNGSQFFMTYWSPVDAGAAAPRFLDFNHTIFGQVVRGLDVLAMINAVPKVAVTDGQASVPVDPVTLMTATMIDDKTDGTITIKAPANGTGGTLTVTATDEFGGVARQVIKVKSVSTTLKDAPFLGCVADQFNAPGLPITIKLSSTDIDGGSVQYAVFAAPPDMTQPPAGVTAGVSGSTITIYPPDRNYTGTFPVTVGVRQSNATSRGSTLNPWDTEVIYLTWTTDATAPTAASVPAPVYANAGASETFNVTYTSDKQLNIKTITNNSKAITVTGHKGIVIKARYVSMAVSADGKSATVTYRMTAPGGSWNAPDAGTYTVNMAAGQVKDMIGNAVAAGALGTFFYSPTVLFNEEYYLARNPDVAAAVAAGTVASGYAQFIAVGQFSGAAPSIYYSDAYYFAANPGVQAAVQAGAFASGYQHFMKTGMAQGLAASSNFNEAEYLAEHPDVAVLVAKKKYLSGLDYFVRVGGG
jgi:cyclophilin family peptidyl-prolyl cis-trans isomerase